MRERPSMYNVIAESRIDFPRLELSPYVWRRGRDQYELKPDVRDFILSYLEKFPLLDIPRIASTVHLTGSLLTNKYKDDADIDIHPNADIASLPPGRAPQTWVRDVFKWYNAQREELNGYIGSHPMEVYLQLDPAQDMLSDGCYDVISGEWLKGPMIVELDFDPYEVYAPILDVVEEEAKKADIVLGELRRDAIDYHTIKQAAQRLPSEVRVELNKKLRYKLSEIENSIRDLLKKKKSWIMMRRLSSRSEAPEEAWEDVLKVTKWEDADATFKMLGRYQYLRIITDLEKMMKDEEMDVEEMSRLQDLLGVR